MKVRKISLDLIDNNGQVIRDTPEDDSIGELAGSLAADGLLQPPGVREQKGGRFELLWGDRRCRAARRLKWEEIECHVYDHAETPQKAVALIENLQRRQLELPEEVKGVTELLGSGNRSVEQVASLLNKTRSWVLSRMAVVNLPDYLQEPLLEGSLNLSQVEEISRLQDDGAKRYLTAQTIQGRFNRAQIRGLAMEMAANPAVRQAQAFGEAVARHEVEIKPIYVQTACCNRTLQLELTNLVRVCNNGSGCQSGSSGTDQENSGSERVDDRPGGPTGRTDSPDR